MCWHMKEMQESGLARRLHPNLDSAGDGNPIFIKHILMWCVKSWIEPEYTHSTFQQILVQRQDVDRIRDCREIRRLFWCNG